MKQLGVAALLALAAAGCARWTPPPLPAHSWIVGNGNFVVDHGYESLGDVLCQSGGYSFRFLPNNRTLIECGWGGNSFSGRRWR